MTCPDCLKKGRVPADAEGALVWITCDKCKGVGYVDGSPDDRLEDMFERQDRFMQLLAAHGRMPVYPVDLTTKAGQKTAKDVIFNIVEELMEASFVLKNKTHRLSDVRDFDVTHYREELGDAFAFFMELCILSGFTEEELFLEYRRKNAVVTKRLLDGY